MKEYFLPPHTVLGGWYIPEQLCDDLMECFKAHPWRWVEEKESTDMYLPIRNTFPAFLKYMDAFAKCIGAYQIKYPELKWHKGFGLVEPLRFQWHKGGGGFKRWHCERTCKDHNRMLAFMTFLNDVPDGGIEFKYQQLTLPAKKGLTVIWPPDFTHTHKGQISKEHEKWIATGWLGYIDEPKNTG
tara:strand:- start:542 stop:1096 length:555 start_codon:yes stop_codon:yes gene_type:complete